MSSLRYFEVPEQIGAEHRMRVPIDPARIDIRQPEHVRYWCERFECSKVRLELAVKTVGVVAADVVSYLRARQ